MSKNLEEVIQKGIQFLVDTQRPDGSWSGPLSSRIRETQLVYEVSKRYGWKEFSDQANSWLDQNRELLGDSEAEILLNKASVDIYLGKTPDLTNPLLYDKIIVRKTLLIYCIGLINGHEALIPEQFQNKLFIYKFIEDYLIKLSGKIKGWSLAEMLCFQIILAKSLNLPSQELINQLLDLKSEGNWFRNPATTALALIALKEANYQITNPNDFREYFISIKQPDNGWTYCEIPIWDTGLSLDSLYLGSNENQAKEAISKGIEYLRINQNQDGGWGFDIELESEADTSSIVLYALRQDNSNLRVKAIEYYKELQFKEGEFKGLWPVWRQSEAPSIEVVAHIVTGLKECSAEINTNLAIQWIEEQVELGNWQADWGRNIPYAINAIIQATKKAYPELIDYLNTTQNSDGGWGAVKGKESNPSATANALMALKRVDIDSKFKDSIEKGIEYLISTQSDDGTWPGVKEVIGPRPFIYGDDCSTHNFVMQALLANSNE